MYMQVLLALCGTVLGVLLLLNALGGWVPSKLGSGHGVTSKLEVMEAALSWSPPVIIHNATDESPECVAKMKQWSTTWAKSHPTARPSALLHHAYPKSSMLESLSTMSIELDNRLCCCLRTVVLRHASAIGSSTATADTPLVQPAGHPMWRTQTSVLMLSPSCVNFAARQLSSLETRSRDHGLAR